MNPLRPARFVPEPPSSTERPETIGGHRLGRPLGGSNAAWELPDEDGPRRMLKVAEEFWRLDGRTDRRTFRRRLRIRKALSHPNMAVVLDGGMSDRGPYTVMTLPEGRPLSALVEDGPLDPQRAVALLTGVADALEHAHAHGLVHLELSPASIVVESDRGGRAYLTDFGIAPAVSPVRVALTPHYRSPEELQRFPCTPQSNVYSLACILYACLAGNPPFERESTQGVFYAQCTEHPPALTTARPRLPPAIDDVLSRGLAKDPDLRTASPGELISQASFALGARIAIAEPPAAATPAAPHRPPFRLASQGAALAVIVAVLAGAAAGWLGAGPGAEPDPGPTAQQRAASSRAATLAAETRTRNQWRTETDAAIARLDSRRRAARRRLASARTRAGQAVNANRVGRTFGAAASRLPAAPPSARLGAENLEAAMRRTQDAYGRLAGAYRRGRGAAPARAAVRRAEAGVRRAVSGLDAAAPR